MMRKIARELLDWRLYVSIAVCGFVAVLAIAVLNTSLAATSTANRLAELQACTVIVLSVPADQRQTTTVTDFCPALRDIFDSNPPVFPVD